MSRIEIIAQQLLGLNLKMLSMVGKLGNRLFAITAYAGLQWGDATGAMQFNREIFVTFHAFWALAYEIPRRRHLVINKLAVINQRNFPKFELFSFVTRRNVSKSPNEPGATLLATSCCLVFVVPMSQGYIIVG